MKLLAYKDLIVGFIKQNIDNKDHKKQIRKIFENENSIFLYSKKFFLYIKEELDEDNLDIYQRLVTQFNDSGQSIKSSDNSKNFDDEMIHIFSQMQDKVIFSVAFKEPTSQVLQNIPNIAIVSQQQKPNYNWLVINLAILHPNKVTVNWSDFVKNEQINQFFSDIFKIPKIISEVNIFDRYCNLDHKQFDSIIAKKVFVNYFTVLSTGHRNPTKNIENRDAIRLKFGGKYKMFTTNSRNAHERRVIFDNFIVYCDNDFWNLQVDASGWDIDVQYSAEIEKIWLSRISKYKEFR